MTTTWATFLGLFMGPGLVLFLCPVAVIGLVSGHASWCGRVAWCGHVSWVGNGSIRALTHTAKVRTSLAAM